MFVVEAVPSKSGVDVFCRYSGSSVVYTDVKLAKEHILGFSMKHPDDRFISHRIPTVRLEKGDAEKKLKELAPLEENGLRFSIENYGAKNAVIHAICPAGLKELLPNYFLKNPQFNNAAQMLRWQTGWFPEAVEQDGFLALGSSISLADLLSEKGAALDIEVEGWENEIKITELDVSDAQIKKYLVENSARSGKNRKESIRNLEGLINEQKKEQVFAVSYFTTHNGNYLLTTYGFGEKKIIAETDIGPVEAAVVECKDQDGLMEKLNQLEKEYDPLFYFGHNISYDLLKLRGLGAGKYAPGKDGSAPRTKAVSGIYKRISVPGAIVIDSAPFSQNYLPQTVDNKLMTVASHLLGINASKKESYASITKLAIEAKLGNVESARKLAEYSVGDGAITLEVGRKLLPFILGVSKFFEQPPGTVCVGSKKNTAEGNHERKHFSDLNTYKLESMPAKKRFDEFSIKELQNSLIDGLRKETQTGLMADRNKSSGIPVLTSRRGIFDRAYAARLVPLVKAAKFLTTKEGFAELYQYALSREPGVAYAEALDSYIERAFFELSEQGFFDGKTSSQSADWIFGKRYEINRLLESSIGSLVESSLQNSRIVSSLLKKAGLINFSANFAVFSDEDVYQELAERGLAVGVGAGRVVSLSKGRFFMDIEGAVYSQGVDVTGRKGFKTINETDMLNQMGELMLKKDFYACLELARHNYEGISSCQIPHGKMIFLTEEARRDYYSYSAPAQQQARIKAYIEFAVLEGEKFGFGYTKRGRTKLPEFLEEKYDGEKYLERLFGPVGRDGRRLSDASVLGDFLLTIKQAAGMSSDYINSMICSQQLMLF